MAEDKKKTARKKKTTNKITLDKNELSEIITNALLEYDKKKEELSDANKNNIEQKGKKGNIINFLFFPKKYYIKSKDMNIEVLKMIMSGIYTFMDWLLFLAAWISLLYIPFRIITIGISMSIIYDVISAVLFFIMCFTYSRLFIVMKMEIVNSKDSNFIFGLFASIMALLSLFVAIIK